MQYDANMPSETRSPILRAFGAVVRRARHDRGFTLKDLAAASGLSQRFLSLVEAGSGNPSLTNLCALAAALESTPTALLSEALPAVDRPLPIALVGLRGAGKSTVGRRSAERIGIAFVELDALVEAKAGMSLPEIFATHGEPYYRRLEHSALLDILRRPEPCIVATGGGIVTHQESAALLRNRFKTIWLRATPEDHWARVVAEQGDRRPVEARPDAMGELRVLWRTRMPLYAQAHHTIDTSRTGVDAAVAELASLAAPSSDGHGNDPIAPIATDG